MTAGKWFPSCSRGSHVDVATGMRRPPRQVSIVVNDPLESSSHCTDVRLTKELFLSRSINSEKE